jgi:uncharacterized protein
MKRRCPICECALEEDSEAHRPFCSERCRMLDLSNWLDGDYTIPGAPVDTGAATEPDNG